MTGESIPVREPGGYVYAGTVVEDGSCVIGEVARSAGTGGTTRL